MKKLLVASTLFLLAGSLAVRADGPKLAIVGVEPSHTLAKKLGWTPESAAAAAAVPPPAPAPTPVAAPAPVAPPVARDFQGTWTGIRTNVRNNRQSQPIFQLVLTKAPNGSYHAEITQLLAHRQYHSDAVIFTGQHVRINFQQDQFAAAFDGDLNLPAGIFNCHYFPDAKAPKAAPFLFRSGQAGLPVPPPPAFVANNQQPQAPAGPPVSPLDSIIRALDTHLVDTFQGAHVFSVMEDADLRLAVPQASEEYNLKDSATVAAFKKAEINYLLVTTIEDMNDQTLDEAQGSVAYSKGAFNTQVNGQIVRGPNGITYTRTASGQLVVNSGNFDKHVKKDQSVRLTIRCRLFDVNSGALLDSVSHTFATNRNYVALAAGNNMASTSDLFDDAAIMISDWTSLRMGDAVFPIKVLDKDDKGITINRGSQGGLHIGETFDVFTTGKEIKDPTTGEVLGRDDIQVGRVAISSVREKFSKASILSDTGITPGATLHPPEK